jgi:hypothetical protein
MMAKGVTIAAGDWISYGCLDWGPGLFHPDDAHLKEPMLAAGPVCEVAGEDRQFWVLRFGPLRVRLLKELVGGGIVPKPAFVWGDQVRTKPPRTERVGRVHRIGWHASQGQHLFWIEQNGKKLKNRYFTEELEQVGG